MVESQHRVKDFKPVNVPSHHIFLLDVFKWMLYNIKGIATWDFSNSEEHELQKAQYMGVETPKRLKEDERQRQSDN